MQPYVEQLHALRQAQDAAWGPAWLGPGHRGEFIDAKFWLRVMNEALGPQIPAKRPPSLIRLQVTLKVEQCQI